MFGHCPLKSVPASQERMRDASRTGWKLGKRALCRQRLGKDSSNVLSKRSLLSTQIASNRVAQKAIPAGMTSQRTELRRLLGPIRNPSKRADLRRLSLSASLTGTNRRVTACLIIPVFYECSVDSLSACMQHQWKVGSDN